MSQVSFLAIDFETANPNQASVCQVGVAKVVNGTIVESDSWLVKPPTGINSFETRFIRIHGITPAKVRRHGLTWQESLAKIHRLGRNLPFVAHNVSFDRTVYRRASQWVSANTPHTVWYDTLALSRRFVTAPNHKLPTVVKALKLPNFRHHDAQADAIASANIALEISRRHGLHTVQELWSRPTGKRSASTRSLAPRRYTRVGDLPTPNPKATPSNPFYGQQVVVTGDLDTMSRDDFFDRLAKVGAQPQLNVTKKTTMLVVAKHHEIPADYDASKGSRNEKKAAEYVALGQTIEFLGTQRALRYLRMTGAERQETAEARSDGGTVSTRAVPSPELSTKYRIQSDLPKPQEKAWAGHPFYGKHVALSGELNGFTFDQFVERVAHLGGYPQLELDSRTDFLIVAEHYTFRSGHDHSAHGVLERQAAEAQQRGQGIHIIGAKEALDYLRLRPDATVPYRRTPPSRGVWILITVALLMVLVLLL